MRWQQEALPAWRTAGMCQCLFPFFFLPPDALIHFGATCYAERHAGRFESFVSHQVTARWVQEVLRLQSDDGPSGPLPATCWLNGQTPCYGRILETCCSVSRGHTATATWAPAGKWEQSNTDVLRTAVLSAVRPMLQLVKRRAENERSRGASLEFVYSTSRKKKQKT